MSKRKIEGGHHAVNGPDIVLSKEVRRSLIGGGCLLAIPFWVYAYVAIFVVVIVAVVAAAIWVLYSHYRKRSQDLPEPQTDPDYPVPHDDER
jgi:Flp pilus assembly protein TadB